MLYVTAMRDDIGVLVADVAQRGARGVPLGAGHAAQAQVGRRGGHDLLAQRVLVGLVAGQLGGGSGIRRRDTQYTAGSDVLTDGSGVSIGHSHRATLKGVANQHMRRTLAVDDITVLVEVHLELTDYVAVLPRLHHANGLAVLVSGAGRVVAFRGQPQRLHGGLGPKQRVRICTHDHIDTAELFGQRQLAGVAHVRGNHDLVDALRTQTIDLRLRGHSFVVEGGTRIRARRILGLVSNGQTDDADLLPITLHHSGGLHRAIRQRGGGRKLGIGAQHRRLAVARVQIVDEGLQAAVGVVELVVAQRERIKADRVHHLGIGLAVAEVEVQVTGHGIARVDLHHVARCSGQRLDGGRHAREAAVLHINRLALARSRHQVELDRLCIEMGVVVVHVQERQRQRLGFGRLRRCGRLGGCGCVVTAAAGGQRKQRRNQDERIRARLTFGMACHG